MKRNLRSWCLALALVTARPSVLAAFVLSSCMPADQQPSRTAYEVLRAHTPELMKIKGVVGTGEGEVKGYPAVVVLVSRRTSEVNRLVPKRLEGYPVEVRVVGDVRPMDRREETPPPEKK